MQINKKKLFALPLTILFCITLMFTSLVTVYATPQDDLLAVQKKLEEIRNKKSGIQNSIKQEKKYQNQLTAEINDLKNQIDLLDTQIQEKELVIQELQLKIDIITKQIAVNEQDILTATNNIGKLQTETDKRLVDMYLDQKTFSKMNIIFSSASTDFIKYDLYENTVQEKTNNLITDLNNQKADLNDKKQQMEDDKITVLKDATQMQEEKVAMEQDKTDLDSQRQVYYRKKNESASRIGSDQNSLNNLTEEEQKVMAEQTRLEQVVFDNIKSIPNGTYVTAGTIIGYEGCTGLCYGPHLHFGVNINGSYVNPCSVLPGGVLSNCGGGAGQMQWPMHGSFVLTSGYGWRWGKFHYGIDIAYYGGGGPIYAAHNGWMYHGFEKCGPNWPVCGGGGANYIIICENKSNCSQGKKTFYWHLK